MPRSYLPSTRALARLVDTHIPFDQPANLTLRVAARQHPFDELVMLGLGVAVLLGLEGDDGKQILDLSEHPLLDHVPDLLVSGPGRVLAVVLRTIAERELHHLVAEVLR